MITEKTIDAYLDAQGVTPGPWYISGTAWIVGKDVPIIKLFDSEINLDAHVMAASRESLKDWISFALFMDNDFLQSATMNMKQMGSIMGFFDRAVKNIESALPGRRWEEIKEALQEIEDER